MTGILIVLGIAGVVALNVYDYKRKLRSHKVH